MITLAELLTSEAFWATVWVGGAVGTIVWNGYKDNDSFESFLVGIGWPAVLLVTTVFWMLKGPWLLGEWLRYKRKELKNTTKYIAWLESVAKEYRDERRSRPNLYTTRSKLHESYRYDRFDK